MTLTLNLNYGINPLPFYWNRFLRLYPMHAFVALAVFILAPSFTVTRMGDLPPQEHLFAFLKSLTLMFSYTQTTGPSPGMLIGPAWTLPYEILFYLFAPFVIGLRFNRLPIGLVTILSTSISWLVLKGDLSLILKPFALGYHNPTAIYTAMFMFGFGALLFELRNLIGPTKADKTLQLLGLLLLLTLIIFGSRYFAPNMQFFDTNFGSFFQVVMYLSASLMLIGWSQTESHHSKLAGDCTYPTYLVHWPILHAGLFDLPILRKVTDWFGHLFPFGHIIATASVALLLSLLASYCLIRLDKRFIRSLRANIVVR